MMHKCNEIARLERRDLVHFNRRWTGLKLRKRLQKLQSHAAFMCPVPTDQSSAPLPTYLDCVTVQFRGLKIVAMSEGPAELLRVSKRPFQISFSSRLKSRTRFREVMSFEAAVCSCSVKLLPGLSDLDAILRSLNLSRFLSLSIAWCVARVDRPALSFAPLWAPFPRSASSGLYKLLVISLAWSTRSNEFNTSRSISYCLCVLHSLNIKSWKAVVYWPWSYCNRSCSGRDPGTVFTRWVDVAGFEGFREGIVGGWSAIFSAHTDTVLLKPWFPLTSPCVKLWLYLLHLFGLLKRKEQNRNGPLLLRTAQDWYRKLTDCWRMGSAGQSQIPW